MVHWVEMSLSHKFGLLAERLLLRLTNIVTMFILQGMYEHFKSEELEWRKPQSTF
jgi:hypothetical protein